MSSSAEERPAPVGQSPDDPGRAKLFLTWIALVLVVGIILLLANMPAGGSGSAAGPLDPRLETTWQLRFVARYVVGANAAVGSRGGGGGSSTGAMLRQSIDQVTNWPANPNDSVAQWQRDLERVRSSVAIAELEGPEAAERFLEDLLQLGRLEVDLRFDAGALFTVFKQGSAALEATDRDRLIDRHGWFAELALSHDLDASDPARQAALAPCYRALAGVAVLTVLAGGGLIVGLGLLITFIVQLARGKLVRRYQRDINLSEKEHRVLLEVLVALLGGLAMVRLVGEAPDRLGAYVGTLDPAKQGAWAPWLRAAESLAPYALLLQFMLALVVLWPLCRGYSWAMLRRAYGVHSGRGVFREIGAGLAVYLAGLPLVALSFVLVFLIMGVMTAITGGGPRPSHPVVEMAGSGGGGWLTVVILLSLGSLWAPIVEEIVFRGAFQRHLRRWAGPIFSGLFTGFVFAMVHPQGIAIVPVLTMMGFIFSMIREWRGSLIGCMIAHGLHNAVLISFALLALG